MQGLKDRVAIVTGGSLGIGKATALTFCREGTKVVIADMLQEEGERVADAINQGGGQAIFVRTNVASEEDVIALVQKTLDTFGQLDFAVNNAGVGGVSSPTADYPLQEWQRVLDVNLNGVWFCMKHEIPAMLKEKSSVIVNMASIAGLVGFAGSAAYVASKHAVIGLTKVAAIEYGAQGLRINAVCPGFIQTPLLEKHGFTEGSEVSKQVAQLHLLKRIGRPEEVAEMIVWLCSDYASFMTGNPLPVDAGFVVQ